MPWEPLRTDEKLEAPVKQERDMDTQMLFGCSSFVIVSLLTYALIVWPFFVWQSIETTGTLGLCLALGLVPAFLVGGLATRRYGLAGAFGFLGGTVATAIFLYLRLQSAHLAALADQAPTPDWPSALVPIVPVTAIILAAMQVAALLPKHEFPDADKPSSPKTRDHDV
jgi:hypothetical protein